MIFITSKTRKKTSTFLLMNIIFLISSVCYAQEIRVTGTVSDEIGEPIPGVNVTVRGTSQGIATNLNGEFALTVPSDTCVLQFRFIGYQEQDIRVGSRRIIAVTMYEKAAELGEVTIVAFGKQKKESVIGSITTIKPAELKVPSSNLTTSFAGRMSGMIAYQRSGEPGADNAEFFIRGVTTFGYKKEPLILIDNVESTTTDLSRLPPDDIASFSIMKDATATALYGSRGANGVILVSTKSGDEGKVKVNVRFEETLSTPTRKIKLADPVTYMQLHNEAVRTRNPLGVLPYSQTKIDKTIEGANPYVYPATDWYKSLFNDISQSQRLNFSMSGGGKVARYYLAGHYIRDGGNLKVDKKNNFNNNINLNRYMLRANININVTKTTEAIVRMSGAFDDYQGPIDSGSDLYERVLQTNPVLFPPYYPADKANQHTQHILYGNYGNTPQYNNPYADMTKGYKDDTQSQLSVQFELKQDLDFLLKGLSIRGMFNTNRYSHYDVQRFYNPFYYSIGSYNKQTDEYTLTPLNATSGTEYLDYVEGKKEITSNTYFEAGANWNDTFNDVHDVSALFVYTMRNELKANAGDLQRSLAYRNIGLAGRITYAFDNRYLFEGNFGYNGSERFSKKERFGFFPSAGLGWILSNESFYSDNIKKVMNNLKLKASYGLVGNDAIGREEDRFFYLSMVNMDNSHYGTGFGTYGSHRLNGISISRYANDKITWETAKKLNISAEIGLWNMLDLQIEWFQEHRTNILQTRESIPSTMGLQAQVKANVGEAKSHGWDISANLNHVINKDWWVTGMANFTYATNEYSVYEEPDYPDAPWRSRIGYSIDQKFGWIAERLFVDEEEVRNSPTQFGNYGAGDIKYKDLNGDGKINELDMVPLGYPEKPEIIYGFGLSTGFKNIDFSFFFQGSARQSIFFNISKISPFINGQSALFKEFADSHWSETDRDIYAVWPRLSPEIIENNNRDSNWYMRDASFLRLKSVELGYSFPEKWISKIFLSNLRLYFTGTNLLTFSKFKLWDPEMGSEGWKYPLQKQFNFGIQASF